MTLNTHLVFPLRHRHLVVFHDVHAVRLELSVQELHTEVSHPGCPHSNAIYFETTSISDVPTPFEGMECTIAWKPRWTNSLVSGPKVEEEQQEVEGLADEELGEVPLTVVLDRPA